MKTLQRYCFFLNYANINRIEQRINQKQAVENYEKKVYYFGKFVYLEK